MDTANECCHEFDPSLYEAKTHVWQDKLFLKDEVKQLFHIPVNMGTVVTRMIKKIEKSSAMPDKKDVLLLCYDPSPWKSELYMTVTKEIPGEKVVKLSGTFISKVYDGPYNMIPQCIKDMDTYLADQNKKTERYYFHYAYCPKCSKKFGHNYIVAFAKVA